MSRTMIHGSEIVREVLMTSTLTGTVDLTPIQLGQGLWRIQLLIDFSAVTGTASLAAYAVNGIGTLLTEEGLSISNVTAGTQSTDTTGFALADYMGVAGVGMNTSTAEANNVTIMLWDKIAFRYIAGTAVAGQTCRIELVAQLVI